jgi:hypothetical protein
MRPSLHSTTIYFPTLHFTSLHFTSLHFTPLHFTSLRFGKNGGKWSWIISGTIPGFNGRD